MFWFGQENIILIIYFIHKNVTWIRNNMVGGVAVKSYLKSKVSIIILILMYNNQKYRFQMKSKQKIIINR